jgi:hypothetical protein
MAELACDVVRNDNHMATVENCNGEAWAHKEVAKGQEDVWRRHVYKNCPKHTNKTKQRMIRERESEDSLHYGIPIDTKKGGTYSEKKYFEDNEKKEQLANRKMSTKKLR